MSVSEVSGGEGVLTGAVPTCWARGCRERLATDAKITLLKAASWLTEPICKAREYYYTLAILDKTCTSSAAKVWERFRLSLGIAVCLALSPFTTPLGAAIRGLVATFQSKPYIFLKRAGDGKVLPPDGKITLACHNICEVPAGYGITAGQVNPSPARLEANIKRIRALNPDIICLQEVAGIYKAEKISSLLPEYPYIIPVAGMRAIGTTSMLYVASKYPIDPESIEFVPFDKGTELSGRAQYSEKGFLSFDLKSQGSDTPFATVISTHLQHSEVSGTPEPHEVKSRAAEMRRIAEKIKSKVQQGRSVIFTGDLNQNEEELQKSLKAYGISLLKRDPKVQGKHTWEGDAWCARLMGIPASDPMVLDYTLVAGKGAKISTEIIGTGFCGKEFRPEAGSDHNLLLSTITLR